MSRIFNQNMLQYFVSYYENFRSKGGDYLQTAIPYLIATLSTTAFIVLWFWVVRKELYAKQKMVEAARSQLTACGEKCVNVGDGSKGKEAQEILKRSQSVYRQAVGIYNKTLRKPWNAFPALFLGFRKDKDGNENKLY